MTPNRARILDVEPAGYHRLPGFSGSVAIDVVQQSPAHANVEREKVRDISDMTDEMIRGSVIHHLVLGRGARFEAVPFAHYRTDAAKGARDLLWEKGVIPVLAHKLCEYEEAAGEILNRIHEAGIRLTGRSEVAIEWYEDDVQCRCMMDHVDLERGEIIELKVTGNAHPDNIVGHVERMGYRIPCAAYIRALLALRPQLAGRISYRFVFAEPEPPYACYIPRDVDPQFVDRGERDWLRAVKLWSECERTNRWTHYNDQTLKAPRWKLRQEGYTDDEW